MSDDGLDSLRDALAFSPDNVPLRRHLAEVLVRHGRLAEAETEFREALSRAPADADVKLGLGRCFFALGKYSEAMVVVEDVLASGELRGPAQVLRARLLLEDGKVRSAVEAYRSGVGADASAADAELAAKLGVTDSPDAARSSELVDGRVRIEGGPAEEGDPTGAVTMERPALTFAAVGGMEKVKEEIRLKIIHPLAHPEIYKAYGKAVGGGILMFGPPGCGKTHIARATAGEVKAGFMAVGLHDILDMWMGESERKLHDLFEAARRNRPCVLFFDEADALAANRSDMRHSAGRHLINQFLSELDGVTASNDGVLVLAATNAPWHLDPAFRRPGRFDRIIFVPPPDRQARVEILRVTAAGKPLVEVDWPEIAKRTEGFSGADLKAVVDVAVEAKLSEAIAAGALKPLSTKDLAAAAKAQKPSTKEWFSTARNYALYSNQGGLYDEILEYLDLT